MNGEEQQLIKQAKQGDVAAFEALVHLHAPLVYNLALRTLNDSQEADDVAQETFLRAWRALPRFQGKSRFSTWLYRITTNLCYNRLPRLRTEVEALEPDEQWPQSSNQPTVEAKLLQSELRQRLYTAVDTLRPSYRLLINLRHMQGLSYADVSEITGLPLGTVKTGLHRARQELRTRLITYVKENNE